jgi:putative oxidoreductase
MRRTILLATRLVLAAVFVVAGALKLRDPAGFANDVANYQLMPALAPVMAVTLPSLEIVVGLALFLARWRRPAALCAAGLMAMFTVAAGTAYARGLDVACGCFGTTGGAIGWTTLVRDLALLGAAILVVALERRSWTTNPIAVDRN